MLLFHSIYFLQILIRVKIFEGVTVPIINFSMERFSEGGKRRFSRLLEKKNEFHLSLAALLAKARISFPSSDM